MKRLYFAIFMLALSAPAHGQMMQMIVAASNSNGSGCGGNGFSACKRLTVQSSQFSGTLTNQTVIVNDTDATLKSTGNGGTVTDAQGDDIEYFPNSNCSGTLHWDPLEFWDATSGAILSHVLLPSVTAGTNFYRCSGKSGVTTFQGGSIGSAWDSAYGLVIHHGNGTTLDGTDYSANALNLSFFNTPTATTGQIDGAANYVSTSYAQTPNTTAIDGTLPMSITCWFKRGSTTSTEQYPILWKRYTGGFGFGVSVEHSGPGSANSKIYFISFGGTGLDSTNTITDTNWHHVAVTIDGSGNWALYIDGTEDSSGSGFTMATAPANSFLSIAAGQNSDPTSFPGDPSKIDELHYVSQALTAQQIAAEYNNGHSPSSFYSVN